MNDPKVLSFFELGALANRRKAEAKAETYEWIASQLVGPSTSINKIARKMNELNIATPSKRGEWSPTMVSRLLSRLKLKDRLTLRVA